MGDIHVQAGPAVADIGVLAHKAHGCQIVDSSFKGQVDRWGSRPLMSSNKDLAKFSSFKGRGYCILQLGYTIGREFYRAFKNILVVFEKTFGMIRNFFQCLFKEDGSSWKDLGERAKEILSSVGAFFVRPLTFVLDILKLGAGVLVPCAAIKA